MKQFITIFVVLYMSVLILRNPTTASPLDNNYFEDNSLEDDRRALLKDLDEYMDQDTEDEELIYPNLQQKRKPSSYKYLMSCVPRGGNCDHRPNNCCNSGSCRCNLWGANCKCQRMGFFQRWGK